MTSTHTPPSVPKCKPGSPAGGERKRKHHQGNRPPPPSEISQHDDNQHDFTTCQATARVFCSGSHGRTRWSGAAVGHAGRPLASPDRKSRGLPAGSDGETGMSDDVHESRRDGDDDLATMVRMRGPGNAGGQAVDALALLLLAAGGGAVGDVADESSMGSFANVKRKHCGAQSWHDTCGSGRDVTSNQRHSSPLHSPGNATAALSPRHHDFRDSIDDYNRNDQTNNGSGSKPSAASDASGDECNHGRTHGGGKPANPAGRDQNLCASFDGCGSGQRQPPHGKELRDESRTGWVKTISEKARETQAVSVVHDHRSIGNYCLPTSTTDLALPRWELQERHTDHKFSRSPVPGCSSANGNHNSTEGEVVWMCRRLVIAGVAGFPSYSADDSVCRTVDQMRHEISPVGEGTSESEVIGKGANWQHRWHEGEHETGDNERIRREGGDSQKRSVSSYQQKRPPILSREPGCARSSLELTAGRGAEQTDGQNNLADHDISYRKVATVHDKRASVKKDLHLANDSNHHVNCREGDHTVHMEQGHDEWSEVNNDNAYNDSDVTSSQRPAKRPKSSRMKIHKTPALGNAGGGEELRLRKACDRCTEKKAGCSGGQPCELCFRRGAECLFSVSQKQRARRTFAREPAGSRRDPETAASVGVKCGFSSPDHPSTDAAAAKASPRKRSDNLVWSQFRRACDRCTEKKVRCDGSSPSGGFKACSSCSKVGESCYFGICRRSGPRDELGHKTAAAGVIMQREHFEKVTERAGSCRLHACSFAKKDGSFLREHFHCRIDNCSFAGKNMSALLLHRNAAHLKDSAVLETSADSGVTCTSDAVQMPNDTVIVGK